MILLDFSTEQYDRLNPEISWQKDILDFWAEWTNNSHFIIAHTSGSTGQPKPIELAKSAMKLSAKMTGEFFDLTKGKTALLCLPVGFIAGKMMLVRAMELKLKLYVAEPKSTIDLSEFPDLDFVPMTPMQVENSLESLSKIKTLLIGGAPLSDALREKLLTYKTQSYESYGMTETITHIGLKRIDESFFSCLNGIKISTDDRNCLKIQTPYFEEAIQTNDIVAIKNERQFQWLGRFDHVINSGGVKLFPEQIEAKLKRHISAEFIISSLPDETLGEKLILVIESKTELISIDELKLLLDKFEVPKAIFHLTEFPRTESGKIKRKELIEQLKV